MIVDRNRGIIMDGYFYQQQCFVVNKQLELFYEGKSDIAKVIEEQIPWIYDDFYENLRNGKVQNINLDQLESFMRFIFNEQTNFGDILICSREVQIQAFNLFNECFYHQLKQKGTLTEETFQYLENVMTFGEETLYFTAHHSLKSVDFSIKGLVKSELYKHNAYKNFCKSK